MQKYKIFLTVLILYVLLNMVIFPDMYMSVTLNGLTAWALNVLPSVLPFIFFTKVLSSLGCVERVSKIFSKPCKKLFRTSPLSAYVFFTSIISGYPVGAKMTADLYQSGRITKSDAFKMTSFCSTSGPMFIIGAVGIGMLANPIYGYIMLTSHILGAFFNGLLYRNINPKDDGKKTELNLASKKANFAEMVTDSALSIITVGAIIAIFFVVITSFAPIFNLFPPEISCVLEGLIEITKGCIDISGSLSGNIAVIACTFVISFGGLSTILQSIAMLDKLNMPIWLFILQKFTHAVTSTVFAILFVLLV